MKKTFILLFSVLITTQTAFSRGSPPPVKVPPSPPVSVPSEVVKGIRFSPVVNYTTDEKAVLAVSEKLANDLVQSSCFENFMKMRSLIDTNGMTAEQVVVKLKTTNLAVPVEMYYKRFSNVVGYRQPPALNIYTNRKFHAGATACSRGSNLTHEWSHSVGFDHSYQATVLRPRSVPYSINAAFEACCICEKNSILKCSIK